MGPFMTLIKDNLICEKKKNKVLILWAIRSQQSEQAVVCFYFGKVYFVHVSDLHRQLLFIYNYN